MELLKKALNKINGLHYNQEYLCLGKENFGSGLYAYLVEKGKIILDVTHRHLFIGYSPLILALTSSDTKAADIQIILTNIPHPLDSIFLKKNVIANLYLFKICEHIVDKISINIYEGSGGAHKFLSRFHQFIVALNNNVYNKKNGNVFLNNNLYRQVQIAYSLPRQVSLITVADDHLYNLFPTDLHGKIEDQIYIISLRYEGKACEQVERLKRIVLTNVDASFYKEVYMLGKNHMQPLKTKENFPFSELVSQKLEFPLPKFALNYLELQYLDSFMHGIHKLLFFKICNSSKISGTKPTLAHIHNSYATYRFNNKIQSNYLLR